MTFLRRTAIRHIAVVGCFTLLLSAIVYIAHNRVPFASQRIGWQAYDSIILPSTVSQTHLDLSAEAQNKTAGSIDGSISLPSYPLDVYAPLLPNPAPITEIAVKVCMPFVKCMITTKTKDDATLGKWVRVERSLDSTGQLAKSKKQSMLSNLLSSLEQRYLFYRKSRRTNVPRVVQLRLVESGVDDKPEGDDWHRVKYDLRPKYLRLFSGEKNLHLYYRTTTDPHPDIEPITELDLVYGDNPAWPSFELGGVINHAHPTLGYARVTLSFRRKPVLAPPTPSLQYRPDGTFTILQIADLHFSVNPEPCRDVGKTPYHRSQWVTGSECVSKNDTLALIENWLDTEHPDLVVFSGDQLNGQSTSWDERSVLPLFLLPLIRRKIPYAVILGNHDSESGIYTRREQMQLIERLPYSVSSVGPTNLSGAGNYHLNVTSPFFDRTILTTLWFLDSGTRNFTSTSTTSSPWWWPFSSSSSLPTGYGSVEPDQIQWLQQQSNSIPILLRPYIPDDASDITFPSSWSTSSRRRWQSDSDRNQKPLLPNGLLFTHIPIPESYNTNPSKILGSLHLETNSNGGQSKKGLFDTILTSSIKILAHGHSHNNADCRNFQNVWICFAGGSSFAAYGEKQIAKRARVFQFQKWGEKVETWHKFDLESNRFDQGFLD